MTPPPPPDAQSLLLYDGFVRAIARGLVHGADEVDDLVQQTWATALARGVRALANPRPFLRRLVGNLAIDKHRAEQSRARREREAARPEATPSAEEILEREAWRRRIVEAVLGLEEPYRETVILRYFENLPPRTVAARQRVSAETVRTRTRRALERLRTRLQDGRGEKTLLQALTPLAGLADPVPFGAGAAALDGTSRFKVAAAAVAAVAATALLVWQLVGPPPGSGATAESTSSKPTPWNGTAASAHGPRADSRLVRTRAAGPAEQSAGATGGARVLVTWPDGSPAAGIGVSSCRSSSAFDRLAARLGRTDASGVAELLRLEPGNCRIAHDRGEEKVVELVPGQVLEMSLPIKRAADVRGIVVDPDDRPVAGAEVVLETCSAWVPGYVVAHSDARGRFELRCAGSDAYVGARASGYAPSLTRECFGAGKYDPIETKLVLRRDKAAVAGRVVGPDGRPVAGARVVLSAAARHWYAAEAGKDEPLPREAPPAATQTGAEGAFRLDDCVTGRVQVIACCAGLPVHRVALRLAAGEVARVELRVPAAASLEGTISRAGTPVAGVTLRVPAPALPAAESAAWQEPASESGVQHECDYLRGDVGVAATARTDAAGRFMLAPLPPGDLVVELDVQGETTQRSVHVETGGRGRLDIELDAGEALRGRIVDELDRPLPGLWVAAHFLGAAGGEVRRAGRADERGRFAFGGGKRDGWYRLVVRGAEGDDNRAFVCADVGGTLDGTEIVLRVDSRKVPTARVRGRLLDADETPLELVSCFAKYPFAAEARGIIVPLEDGRLDLGLLPAGELTLVVSVRGVCTFLLGPHALARGATWDFGTRRLARPAQLEIELGLANLPRAPRAWVVVRQRGVDLSWIERTYADGVLTVVGLLPGDYEVAVIRDDLALRLRPVHLETGANTVAIPVTRGTLVPLVLREQSGVPALELTARYSVIGADGAVVWGSVCGLGSGREAKLEGLRLAPGRYRIDAEASTGARGSVELVVGSEPGPLPELVLQ